MRCRWRGKSTLKLPDCLVTNCVPGWVLALAFFPCYCIALHCIALHCIALHCIALLFVGDNYALILERRTERNFGSRLLRYSILILPLLIQILRLLRFIMGFTTVLVLIRNTQLSCPEEKFFHSISRSFDIIVIDKNINIHQVTGST